MKKSFLTLTTLIAGSLAFITPSVRADKAHDHSAHTHAADSTQGGAAMSSHDGMTALYQHLGEMEKEIAAGKLDGIHGHDAGIRAAVKDLDKDTTLTAEKKKRVQGYVKNVLKLSGKLHVAADGNKLEQAEKELVKLKAQVDLLGKQFAHSHKPGASDKANQEGAQ